MTDARSSTVQVRSCVGGEVHPHLVPPDLGVHEDAIEIEDDAPRSGSRSLRGRGSRHRLRRRGTGFARGRLGSHRARGDRKGSGPSVDSGEEGPGEAAAIASPIASTPVSTWASAWKVTRRWPAWISTASSPSWTRIPADDLGRGSRTLARDVDPDVDLDESAGDRDEHQVADRRVVAPHDPAFRVRLGAEGHDRRSDDCDDLGRGRVLHRRMRAPLAESHPTLRSVHARRPESPNLVRERG